MGRYDVYQQNKKWIPVILSVSVLVLVLLMYGQHPPLKKAEVKEQNGRVVSLPISQSFGASQKTCPELEMPNTLTFKMVSQEEIRVSILTTFGWREMKTFPAEDERECMLLGLEAWSMQKYYLKVEQGGQVVYLHFEIVSSDSLV